MKSLLKLLALITVCSTTAIAQTSAPANTQKQSAAETKLTSGTKAAPKPTHPKQSGQKITEPTNSLPSSQSKVAPMQVMSQQAAPMNRATTQPGTPPAVPPKKK